MPMSRLLAILAEKRRLIRPIVCLAALAASGFLLMACLGFSPEDGPSGKLIPPPDPPHNPGGRVGAYFAYQLMHNFGPGALVLVLGAGIGALLAFKRVNVTDGWLRVVGTLLLAMVASTISARSNLGEAGMPCETGGVIGIAASSYVLGNFGSLITMLVIAAALAVGVILALDTVILAVPNFLVQLRSWNPAESFNSVWGSVSPWNRPAPVAAGGAAIGAAGVATAMATVTSTSRSGSRSRLMDAEDVETAETVAADRTAVLDAQDVDEEEAEAIERERKLWETAVREAEAPESSRSGVRQGPGPWPQPVSESEYDDFDEDFADAAEGESATQEESQEAEATSEVEPHVDTGSGVVSGSAADDWEQEAEIIARNLAEAGVQSNLIAEPPPAAESGFADSQEASTEVDATEAQETFGEGVAETEEADPNADTVLIPAITDARSTEPAEMLGARRRLGLVELPKSQGETVSARSGVFELLENQFAQLADPSADPAKTIVFFDPPPMDAVDAEPKSETETRTDGNVRPTGSFAENDEAVAAGTGRAMAFDIDLPGGPETSTHDEPDQSSPAAAVETGATAMWSGGDGWTTPNTSTHETDGAGSPAASKPREMIWSSVHGWIPDPEAAVETPALQETPAATREVEAPAEPAAPGAADLESAQPSDSVPSAVLDDEPSHETSTHDDDGHASSPAAVVDAGREAGTFETAEPAALQPPPLPESALVPPPLPTEIETAVANRPAHAEPLADADQSEAAPAEPATDYSFPEFDLLEDPKPRDPTLVEKAVRDQAAVLEKALAEFGVEAQVVAVDTGPVVTLFELELAPGVKINKITALESDLARALKAPSARVVVPLPDKSTIGLEVPNTEKDMVRLKELLKLTQGRLGKMQIPLFLGKDASGKPLTHDLTSMPHLLIAGTTGSGKSVCINSIILSILMTQRPDEVKLVLIDPKAVELAPFANVPHLMCPVVGDMRKAESILVWAVEQMEERYALLAEAGVRNIAGYNRLSSKERTDRLGENSAAPAKLPYIVIVIDELADLMMSSGKAVEAAVTRLAQKSRAVGVHLIVATQRPSVDVVTGLIKANLPARISFRVASRVDSRTILDQKGADLLLGQGDMLFLVPGTAKLLRAQGTYISDEEVFFITESLAEKAKPEFAPELVQMRTDVETDIGERDDLFDEAVKIVLESRRGSVSLLQRRLNVGYSRAARLVDNMAAAGIVGEYRGSSARDVLMTLEEWETLRQIRNAPPV